MSATAPSSFFTIGVQGPPGVGLVFTGLTVISFAQTGTTLVSGAFYPIDTTGGPVTVLCPPAVAGNFFGVGDIKANAAINPISIQAVGGGITIFNQAAPGTYGSSSLINTPGGPVIWYAYLPTISAWIPIWR